MNYYIRTYNQLPDEAFSLRVTVFVDEQGFVDEFDEVDKIATHLVLYEEGGKALGTCRVFAGEEEGSYLLGRFCVLKEYRGKGLGTALIAAAEEAVKSLGGKSLSLHSQYQARDFYKKSGYEQYGELEYEQGCPHIWLKKELA